MYDWLKLEEDLSLIDECNLDWIEKEVDNEVDVCSGLEVQRRRDPMKQMRLYLNRLQFDHDEVES